MGSYLTSTSYSTMLPNFLKGNTTTSDAIGLAVINRQVLNAEAVVNSAIGAKYSIPDFTAIPPILRSITEAITIYNVLSRTGYIADDRNDYMDDFKSAMDTLEAIRDGKQKLTYTNGSIVSTKSSKRFLSSTDGYTPTFDLDDQEDWEVDDDRLDDIEDARDD